MQVKRGSLQAMFTDMNSGPICQPKSQVVQKVSMPIGSQYFSLYLIPNTMISPFSVLMKYSDVTGDTCAGDCGNF